jgi:hypothetical protein
LELLGTEDTSRVFVLGVNERRVTVYAQQCRALNLSWALMESRFFSEGRPRVVVVGGGIGGLTAAAALARVGAEVTVLERAGSLIPKQAGSHTRFLHPHVYDWPAPGWDRQSAALPIMSWNADSAGAVSRTLLREFKQHSEACGVHVVTGATVTGVREAAAGHVALSWNAPGFAYQDFDLAIFATGFGDEPDTAYSRSYWHDDDLHQLRNGRVLVSGTGDGGLTDALRLCIQDFSHDEIVNLLSGTWVENVRERVLELEERADATPDDVTAFYVRELDIPALLKELEPRVVSRVSRVVLNGRSPVPFDLRSAPLNRVLVAQLMKLGLAFRPGHVSVTRDGSEFRVAFQNGGVAANDVFDRVVLRHGPESAPLGELPVAPALNAGTVARLTVATDLSRRPSWTGAFAEKVSRRAIRRRANPAQSDQVADQSWEQLRRDKLDALTAAAWDEHLLGFIDGRDPEWGDIVGGRAPERVIVTAMRKEMARRLRQSDSGISRIAGSGGEGKSTALMQLVNHIVRDGIRPTVLWRAGPERSLPWLLMRSAPSDRPLVIVSDRAHELKPLLGRQQVRTRLAVESRDRDAPTHLLLCATDADWGLRNDRIAWMGCVEHEPWTIAGLSLVDAARLVRALTQMPDPQRALGLLAALPNDDARAHALVRIAQERMHRGDDGAFLGALLKTRTGGSVEDHVLSRLETFAQTPMWTGHDALTIYLHAAVLQVYGFGPIGRDTLASALDVNLATLDPLLRQAVSSELEVRGEGARARYRIRHDAIARAAWKIVLNRAEWRAIARTVLFDTVRAVVTLYPDGWQDPLLREIFYLSDRLLDQDADFAIAAAEGAYSGAPNNPFLLSKLAWALREGRGRQGAREASELIASQAPSFETWPGGESDLAGLIVEWAACAGTADTTVVSAERSLFLAGLGMTDVYHPDGAAEGYGSALGEIGRALMDLQSRDSTWPALQPLAAVVALGAVIPTRHRETYRQLIAGQPAVSDTDAIDVLLLTLERARPRAPTSVATSPLEFEKLRALLHPGG